MKAKINKFISEHKALWQFVMFTLMSSIAAVVEVSSYLLLNSVFLKSLNANAFNWWIFRYDGGVAGGLGTMIAFMVSTTLANIVAFIANRKKTFDANNNVVFSATVYALMIITIICAQTYFGPILVNALNDFINNAGLSGALGKFICMAISFAIIFPMSKYVIMRKKEELKEENIE